jgi:hypothetical protein
MILLFVLASFVSSCLEESFLVNIFTRWGLVLLRIGPVEGSCERGNELSGSIKRWEVLEWLHNWQFLKKGSAL